MTSTGTGSSQGERASDEPVSSYIGWWALGCSWLMFLIFPIQALTEVNTETFPLVLGWIGTIGFGVVYATFFFFAVRAGWSVVTRVVVTGFCLMALCAFTAIAALGGNALSFVPFFIGYAAFGMNLRWQITVSILACVVIAAGSFLLPDVPTALVVITPVMCIVVFISTRAITRSDRDERLRTELVISRERESLARDVHDELGHSITAIRLKAQLAERLIGSDLNRARAEIAEISELASRAIASVRGTVTGLRTMEFGEQVAASRVALADAGVTLSVTGSTDDLDQAKAITAGWIVREATTNIIRHASAQSASIVITKRSLSVTDDGRGLAEAEDGNGMRGMRERATRAGAHLRVESPPAGGTTVEVVWP